jgi:hypothetical protein
LELGREDDGHDDAIYGDDFAEDDGDEVLGADAGRFNTAADDGGAGYEDAPIGRGELVSLCGPLWGLMTGSGGRVGTTQLLQRRGRCRGLSRYLPMRMGILFLGTGRPR